MKLELVLIPSTGHGHLRPLVEVAKLLVHGHDHLSITVIITPPRQGLHAPSLSSYISSLSTTSRDRLRFIVLSDADRSNSPDTESSFHSYTDSYKPAVKAIVAELIDPAGPDLSKLVGFVVDMFCTTMIDVANEFNVQSYLFYPSSGAFRGLQVHMQYLCDVEKYDVGELKDSDTELEVPFLTRSLPAKCVPSVILNKEWLHVVLSHARRFQETKGILIDTFAELEPQAVKFISGEDSPLPTVYALGPVGLGSVDDNQTEVLRWLDDQPHRSVVFLCFGSMGGFSEEQASEIATALEGSGHRFLWSLRRASPNVMKEPPREFSNLEEILPKGFIDRMKGRPGKVIGWAPQAAVLEKPAIGGFISHGGWNSTLESLWFGVPTAIWPLYAEQKFNAFEMVEELGLSVEIRKYWRGDLLLGKREMEIVTAEEIERGIRALMEQSSDVRKRVKEMSEKCHVALMEGGSSRIALQKFVQEITDNIA